AFVHAELGVIRRQRRSAREQNHRNQRDEQRQHSIHHDLLLFPLPKTHPKTTKGWHHTIHFGRRPGGFRQRERNCARTSQSFFERSELGESQTRCRKKGRRSKAQAERNQIRTHPCQLAIYSASAMAKAANGNSIAAQSAAPCFPMVMCGS